MSTTHRVLTGDTPSIRFATQACSLGIVLVAASDRGICAILLGNDADALEQELRERFPGEPLQRADDDLEELVARVMDMVERPARRAAVPLDVRGTPFQQRVWRALAEVPPGTTTSYSEVAAQLGSPHAVRAIARACAANPLAVAIPCHRVVRSDGTLAGYRWGVDRKRTLLQREAGV